MIHIRPLCYWATAPSSVFVLCTPRLDGHGDEDEADHEFVVFGDGWFRIGRTTKIAGKPNLGSIPGQNRSSGKHLELWGQVALPNSDYAILQYPQETTTHWLLAFQHEWRAPPRSDGRREIQRNVVVNSLSDLDNPSVSIAFTSKICNVNEDTPQHTCQILTKRTCRLAELAGTGTLPTLPNVWLGTSVKDSNILFRIEELGRVGEAIRFVSFEPLIWPVGPVDLSGIGWAIASGESGPGARSVNVAWIDEICDACRRYGAALTFEQ